MTSNTAPSGVASTGSNQSGYEAYKVFDGDGSTRWLTTAEIYSWVQYQFTSAKIIEKVMILAGGIIATDITFTCNVTIQGSNDGVTFTDIHTFQLLDTENYKEKKVKFNNSNAYTYYRLSFDACNIQNTSTRHKYNSVYTVQFYERYLA